MSSTAVQGSDPSTVHRGAPAGEPLLAATDLVAGYVPGVNILNDCNLVVHPGELVGIIGPNGAGKSTLLKALFGLVTIRSGSVVLKGEDITNHRADSLVRRGVGFVPQTNNVFPSLSIQENLEMGLFQAPKRFTERFDFIVDLFPVLGERRKQRAGSLSGGERQMVAMARALMMDPSVLLLDEPSAGLSPVRQDETFIRTRKINKAGVSVVIVEQNARRCLQICDRAYVLDQGSNAYSGPGRELMHDPKVIELYLGTLATDVEAATKPTPPAPRPDPRRPALRRGRQSADEVGTSGCRPRHRSADLGSRGGVLVLVCVVVGVVVVVGVQAQAGADLRAAQRGDGGRGAAPLGQLVEQPRHDVRHLRHGPLDGALGRRARGLHPADLAHELPRGRLDLLRGGARLQPPQRRDVPAHQPCSPRTICCTAQRFPSGSAKNRKRPHAKSCTSPTSSPRPVSSVRAASMSSTTSCRPSTEPGGIVVRPVPIAMDAGDPGGVSCTNRMPPPTSWSWSSTKPARCV